MKVCTSPGRRLRWLTVVGLVVAASLATGPVPDAAAAPNIPVSAMNSSELALLRYLNQERVGRGLAPMVHDDPLASTSRNWSGHMAAINVLFHDPNLRVAVNALGVNWRSIGENVGYGGSADQLHGTFLASPDHRANMMSSKFNRVGIGTVQSGSRLWVTVRFMEGPPINGTTGLGGCGGAAGTRTVTAGDFSGDGFDDVVVNCPGTGEDRVLLGAPDGVFRSRSITVRGTYVPIAGDFNGDGRTNVVWYAPGPASDHLGTWNGTSFASIRMTVNGHYEPHAGDFDGDGFDDILWYAPGPASDYIWYGTRTSGRFVSRGLRVNGIYEVAITDLDGDGRDDVFWYGPGSAADYVHYSLRRGRHQSVRVHVNGRYQPIAGDFDGAGGGDILWYAPGSASDYVWYGTTRRGSYHSVRMTVNGTYDPVAGDFDGDRRTDVIWTKSVIAGSPLWYGTGTRGRFRLATAATS